VLSSVVFDLLRGVWALSTSNAWAVGGAGRILHWDGEALTVVPSGTGNTLYGIWGFSAAEVWAVGNGPVILRWRE
jgi:hypothetical protein